MTEVAWPPPWPRVLDARFGVPDSGEYRRIAEDFIVEERLGFAPEGQGEHLWLWLEKRDMSTAMLARTLARLCDVPARNVGYAGMKDRQAVTRQWLSVQLPGREAPVDLAERLAEMSVALLEMHRHPRKLKRGVHDGNHFRLRVRGMALASPAFDERWQWLCRHGVPNYFGPQRFGPEGRNLQRARQVLERGWRKRDDRDGMLLSAARSFLFNDQLGARVTQGSWDRPLKGEVLMLDGSNSLFVAEQLDEALQQRVASLDVHPSGVLWGHGESTSQDEALAHERRLAEAHPQLCAGLERAGVRLARRALRVRLTEAHIERLAEQEAWLSFTLPRGAFATAVLRELIAHPTLGPRSCLRGGNADASSTTVQ